jgi:hypothetical protein
MFYGKEGGAESSPIVTQSGQDLSTVRRVGGSFLSESAANRRYKNGKMPVQFYDRMLMATTVSVLCLHQLWLCSSLSASRIFGVHFVRNDTAHQAFYAGGAARKVWARDQYIIVVEGEI